MYLNDSKSQQLQSNAEMEGPQLQYRRDNEEGQGD